MTPNAFHQWLRDPRKRGSVEYHRGFLWWEPDLTAALAWQAYEHGLVALVQRRHGRADYSYIAQKRSTRRIDV